MALSQAEIRERVNPSRFSQPPAAISKRGKHVRLDIPPEKQTLVRPEADTSHVRDSKPNISLGMKSWVTRVFLLLILLSFVRAVYEIEGLPSRAAALLEFGLFEYREDYSSSVRGLRDFALDQNGASIAFELTSEFSDIDMPPRSPLSVLEDYSQSKGCWNVSGTSAQISVIVSSPVRPKYFAIDYLLKERAHSWSAPRTVTVWGIVEGTKNRNKLRPWNHHLRNTPPIPSSNPIALLGSFQYSRSARASSPIFSALDHIQETQVDFEVFIFYFEDNWGASYTTVCRPHIYGEAAKKIHWFSSWPWW